jgi:hypothetical protein
MRRASIANSSATPGEEQQRNFCQRSAQRSVDRNFRTASTWAATVLVDELHPGHCTASIYLTVLKIIDHFGFVLPKKRTYTLELIYEVMRPSEAAIALRPYRSMVQQTVSTLPTGSLQHCSTPFRRGGRMRLDGSWQRMSAGAGLEVL